VLSKYLGAYVNGLQRENLQFSLSHGNVVLENLELKKEALDELDLPITVKEGSVLLSVESSILFPFPCSHSSWLLRSCFSLQLSSSLSFFSFWRTRFLTLSHSIALLLSSPHQPFSRCSIFVGAPLPLFTAFLVSCCSHPSLPHLFRLSGQAHSSDSVEESQE
jgi:VPS13-like, N-terminal